MMPPDTAILRDLRATLLVRGEQSDGRVALAENTVPPRWEGPPLHRHDFDEAFYVLEGELTFQVGERLSAARPGELAFAALGVPHALANLSDESARYLLVRTPAGLAYGSAAETIVTGPRIGGPAPPAAPRPRARVNVLLRSADSGGRVAVMDNSIGTAGAGPPFHHHAFDEAFYVVDGELTFRLGDELATAGPGELVFAPAGAPHTFANLSGAEARVLIVCTPGGFERYFDRIVAREAGLEPPTDEAWPEVVKVGPAIGAPS